MGNSVETKPGLKTTEFWTHTILQILLLLNTLGVWDYIPQKYSAYVQGILGFGYMLSRGIAKQGIPNANTNAPSDDGVN